MQKFKNKVVWITGASSGIGEATAYRFAEESATLILTALEADKLEEVKARCIEKGAAAVALYPYDLSNLADLPAWVETVWAHFGTVDIMYNNAGISQRTTTIDTEMSMIQRIMDVDYYAPVMITKILLPKMIAKGGGHLVVTTSIAGRFGFPLRCAYSSAKHALYGFFETVRAEYYDQNIRVTIVCPGRVQTNISFYALDKGGVQHGKLDAGQAAGVTPEQAACKIVKAIEKEKREVLVGKKELIMVYIKRFFPALAAQLVRKIKPM